MKRKIANAFASTFYFFADTQGNAKKIKRACKPTHGKLLTCNDTASDGQKHEPITAGLKKLGVQ